MNSDQIKQVRQQIEQLGRLDFQQLIEKAWPETPVENIKIGSLSSIEFSAALKRIREQFNDALEEDAHLLPFNFSDPEVGSATVLQHLNQLNSHLNGGKWSQAANNLLFLARYQMSLGFWDRSRRRVHAGNDKKAITTVAEAEARVGEAAKILEKLRKQNDDLEKLVAAKRAELDEIVNLRDAARTNRQEIEQINNDASAKKEKLGTLVSNQEANAKKVEDVLTSFSERHSELKQSLEKISELQRQTAGYQEEIEGKRNEIIELTSKAADGSLGGTFKARFSELEKRVRFWLWGIPVAFLIGVIWFALSFIYIPAPGDDPWIFFLFLTGKIAPTLIIIFFALKQYARERSFLEEYAFKAAVAFTVNAYADQLASERFGLTREDFPEGSGEFAAYLRDRETARKGLIQETVEKLYRPPLVHGEKAPALWAFRPRSAKEILQEARDLVKEAKSL